jgi:hypothetical protein
MTRILIVGGYGAFGSLLAERLAREADLDLIIAGRDEARAAGYVRKLRATARARLHHAVVDAMRLQAQDLAALHAAIVINASGPFQLQDYSLARAAIAARVHYIDLADARAFVTGITALDASAKAAGVSVISGASSVPGLSSAVFLALRPRFARVRSLEISLSPGNHFNPGEATTRSVLSGVGQPIVMRDAGKAQIVYGWQGLRRRKIPGIGRRWFGYVDVPDLELFQAADPDLETVRFEAGVEVGLFHLSLWALSGLVRAGLIGNAEVFARPLIRAKAALGFLGSDRGGVIITLRGEDVRGAPLAIDWSLAATHGHGPYVPTIAGAILAKRLVRGARPPAGAMACFGLFTVEEFLADVADLRITTATGVRNERR